MSEASVFFANPQQFQAQLDALSEGDELELHAFEYPGPVVIRKKVALDGHGATLWALKGPVCIIESPGVTLKDIRIEVTGDDIENGDASSGCALRVLGGHNVQFEGSVQVRGSVQGLPAEEGQWRYPLSIDLGDLEYGHEYRFLLRLYVPVPCGIKTKVYGISVNPHTLTTPGRHEVTLAVDTSARDAVLLGPLYLQTAFLKRQISVSGRIVQSAPGRVATALDGQVLYDPPDWDQLGSGQAPHEKAIEVKPPVPVQPPPPPVKPPLESTGLQEPKRSEPPAPPSSPVGKSATRITRREVVLSPLFNQETPPPVETDAGHIEPGVKLSPVFARLPLVPDTQTVPSAQEGGDGPFEGGSTSVVSDDKDRSESEEQPVLAQEHKGEPKKKTPFRTKQSLPVGNVFIGNGQPAQQDKEEGKDLNSPLTDSQTEKTKPRGKHKRPRGDGTVPNIFFQ